MTTSLSPQVVESLFLEKLLEKYKLNARDIKKAFLNYDKDNNGLLDLDELQSFISMYLNGVKNTDIANLVSRYDLNGDGKISYEELLHLFTTRSATTGIKGMATVKPKANEITTPTSRQRQQQVSHINLEKPTSLANSPVSKYDDNRNDDNSSMGEDNISVISSSVRSNACVSVNSSRAASSEIQSVLDTSDPKHLEYRAKMALQNLRSILTKKAIELRSQGKVQNRLTMTTPQLLESVACKILLKEFSKYEEATKVSVKGIDRVIGVDFHVFCDAITRYSAPGTGRIRDEVLEFIFSLCIIDNTVNPPEASPYELMTLLFGKVPTSILDGMQKMKVSSVSTIPLVAKIDEGRQLVGVGPFKDPDSNSYELNKADSLANTAAVTVPLRFISRKSRTALTAPSNFELNHLKKSASPPNITCDKEYIFGMSNSISSGSMIHAVPAGGSKAILIYAAAGVGVVHELTSNQQIFYEGHGDDITCIAVTPDGSMAATGSCGSHELLLVHVWSTASPHKGPIMTLGKGFFQRFISAVAFSCDGKYLSAIGADDSHTMGIWSIATGQLVHTTTCQHGLPPQIKNMVWSPEQHYTDYITKTHSGVCDIICTVGEHHLRLWSFRRPIETVMTLGGLQEASVVYKGLTMGKMNCKPAKIYTCSAYITGIDKNIDVIVGGSNGLVYLFRLAECVVFCQAIKGGVSTLQVVGDKVVCGGARGCIKLLDGRTLSTLATCNLAPSSIGINPSETDSTPRRRPTSSNTGNSMSSLQDGEENASHTNDVVSVALTLGSGGRGTPQIIHAFTATASGVLSRVDFNGNTVSKTKTVFEYHVGAVCGLAVENTKGGQLVVTAGDDRKLCVWDALSKTLVCKTSTSAAARCCHIDKSSSFIAVGTSSGSISVLGLTPLKGYYQLSELAYRKDSKDVISDIKFSDNCLRIATGSHDSSIYVYSCNLDCTSSSLSCTLRAMHKLKGHTAYITHLDWSLDSRLIQSTCGAYELLCWDADAGKLYAPSNVSDIRWKTNTCVLGFNIMGIWKPYSDGTDINAVDVSKEAELVATADDFGKLNILRYPSVVKSAPCKSYNGHTSHAMNVKFLNRKDSNLCIATVGGKDSTVILWCVDDVKNR